MHSGHINPIVFVAMALVLAGCLFSLWKGGRPERLGGAVVLANTLVVAVIVLVVMVVPVYIAQRLAGGGESATGGGQRAALRSETEPGL